MKLVHGDSLDVLKEMEANTVDTIVTDPPYFLIGESGGGGFMNKEWDGIIGLWKYQLADEVFADFVIRLLKCVRVEKSLEEENIVLNSVSTIHVESQTLNNVNSANKTSTSKTKKQDSVQAIALTKQGLLDLLNELSVTHTKLIQFLNGESETALYVIPILSLQKELKNYVAKPVTLLSKAKETEVTRITFTKTEVQRISDATEGMIGTSLEKPFTNEMNGNADIVVNTVLLKKYSATTSNPTESEEIIRSLTLLLCAYDATRTSKEIQQHMIVTFFKVIFLEAKRVLKPGGTVMAFSGSRTQHHLAQGLEQSGYLLKDSIMYMYGSGFPKATDISKQLDKMDAVTEQQVRRFRFTKWVVEQGVTAKQIDLATETKMGSHYTTHPTQPSVMTREHLDKCSSLFNEIPQWVYDECDKRSVESKNFAAREVVGVNTTKDFDHHKGSMMSKETTEDNETKTKDINITTSKTPEAKLWNGWKSHGLKPAYEPILICQKPNEGTYAANALKHGVSGLNIDGGRIGTDEITVNRHEGYNSNSLVESTKGKWKGKQEKVTGRFPANLILDEIAGDLLDEQSGVTKSSNAVRNNKASENTAMSGANLGHTSSGHSDKGGASRFFYCAKASKAERNAGCEGLEIKQTTGGGGMNNTEDDVCGKYGSIKAAASNHHPTVKPLKLMEYLCTLTKTPTGGVVLDPFMGSGSTGVACKNTGRDFIGIEREAEYIEIARARLGDN